MSKYNLRYNYRDNVSTSSLSPLAFMHRTESPGTSVVFKHNKQYKSPDSTPTTSPVPMKGVSYEEVNRCYSAKKGKGQSVYLLQKIAIQDKRIKLLEEENKRLANCRNPESWEKELQKRNGEIRKLEEQVKYYKEIGAENRDLEKMNEEIERREYKIAELTRELDESESKNRRLREKYKSVVREKEKIVEEQKYTLKKEECELLLTQIQEMELGVKYQEKVNNDLKEEIEKMKKDLTPGTFNYFALDISKIRVEMHKLATIVNDFAKGKEITLKGLLGLDTGAKLEPVKQLSDDIMSIKSDLSKVLTLISDFHAEQFADMACRTQ